MSEPRRITERYRLEKRVSSKDSGSVFRAVDTLSGATVAVKLINTGDIEEHREPFEAHLAALQEIEHPALPRILDFGFTTAGSAFLVTEHVDGDDLGDLVDAPPARILNLLLQVVDGLEALAGHGLSVRNLSPENLRIATGPEGEQVKILGLGGVIFRGEDGDATGVRADVRAFAHLTVHALGLSASGEETIVLPLEVAGALAEPERLREILNAALHGDAGRRFPDWTEIRNALRTALHGDAGRRSAVPAARTQVLPTVQVPRMAPWEEVRLGQGKAVDDSWHGDATMAVEKLGPAPPTRPAPPASSDLTTRVFHPEELAPALPEVTPPPPPPPMRIPLKDLVDEVPAAEVTRTTPPPFVPPPVVPEPTPAEPVLPQPVLSQPELPPIAAAPPQARAPRSPMNKELRLALLIGIPLTLLLAAGVALVAWMSRHSAEPEPPPPPVEAAAPAPIQKPASPLPAPPSIHAQILLAEESLNASDLAAAKTALDAIAPEDVALFTAEEKDRYQRAREALTPLQSQQWADSLTRGLKNGDLRLLRAAAAAPPVAATLTPEQKKDLARARKILDLDSRLSKAQRAKDHAETVRQAGLLLAELPRNSRAAQARDQAADALLAEVDARAGQAQLDAALAALEELRSVWIDHPGIAGRLERIRADRRADEQMEDALAAATRAERAERPLDGLQSLDRVRPNERFAGRFQQARERLQAQFAQLDRNPPQISMAGPSELSYKEEETVTILLRITDDQGVKSTEGWVRPEGGRFSKVFVRHQGGSDYAIDVGPSIHERKSIDFYLTATDESGHEGALGSVQRPQRIKRKGWLSKVLGGKEGG